MDPVIFVARTTLHVTIYLKVSSSQNLSLHYKHRSVHVVRGNKCPFF
jgi:hypothetical protein